MTIKELIKRISDFDLVYETAKVINDKPEELVELNQEQLKEGMGNDDEPNPLYKTERYVEYKKERGVYTSSTYNMLLTRQSYNTMTASANGDVYSIKTEGALKYWHEGLNDRLLGLSPYSKIIYKTQTLLPELVKSLKNKIKS